MNASTLTALGADLLADADVAEAAREFEFEAHVADALAVVRAGRRG
ncbi:hypothetical protein [Cellulosimicrobium sp. TH-20]|nr:hypothetical protein [Cellulosimicrobium sp. TH-20]